MNRPALATAGTVLGLLLLLGGKAATSADQLALPGQSNVALAPTAQGTVTGPVVDTRYGPVQVRATVKAGQLTDVQALAVPTGGRSGSISDYSAPILRREALAAQGAGIHAVSGATYTSEGYASSLQAALDQLAQPGPVASSGQAGKG
jgi:uncharacterized protein with FMN-binding domain